MLSVYPERIEIVGATDPIYIGQKGVVALEEGREVVYLDSSVDKVEGVQWKVSPPRPLDLGLGC